MTFFNKAEIDNVAEIAFEAGEIAKKFFSNKNFTVKTKADESAVTSADIAVSEFISVNLTKLFPKIPIICEEGILRDLQGNIFWLIDPIDGTNSFVEGVDEFAINIALVKDARPIFGLIYAPLFESAKMFYNDEKSNIVAIVNGQKSFLQKDVGKSSKKLRIVTSRRTKDSDIALYLQQNSKNITDCEITKLSSAVKFFRILEGKSDVYFHPRKTMEWDTAAGQALVDIFDFSIKTMEVLADKILIGDELSYQKKGFINQPFICNDAALTNEDQD